MKREKLEQLRAMHMEIETLMEQYYKTPEEYLGDTVKDYKTGKGVPYLIQGYSTDKRDHIMTKINNKMDRLHKQIEELEDYLDNIQDSEMRDILRLYYGQGLSQQAIADQKGYTRSAITLKLKRHFEKD